MPDLAGVPSADEWPADWANWERDSPSLGTMNCPECGRFAKIVEHGHYEHGEYGRYYCTKCGPDSFGA